MELIATGDAVITRGISGTDDVGLAEIRSLLAETDAALVNLESALPGELPIPAVIPQGMHLAGHPCAVEELKWLHVSACNLANNHVMDYSHDGLTAALHQLRGGRMTVAGAGETLAEARAPAFVETSAGRVALIGISSSTASRSLAADPGLGTRGRPGINPLRFHTTYQVTEDQLRLLKRLDHDLGTSTMREQRVAASLSRAQGQGEDSPLPTRRTIALQFAGRDFVVGDSPRVITLPYEKDMDESLRAIAWARTCADTVVVSVHCHEGAHEGWNTREVPDFLVQAAHGWIDAGADAVIGHGPHCLRGVELYRGKPIVYSLGNFIQTIDTVSYLPTESYEKQGLPPGSATVADYFNAYVGFDSDERFWTAALARLHIGDGDSTLDIIPIQLNRDAPRYRRGQPYLPTRSKGLEILDHLAELSAGFGVMFSVLPGATPFAGRAEPVVEKQKERAS